MSKLVQLVSEAISKQHHIPEGLQERVSRAAIETVITEYKRVAEQSLAIPVKKGRGAFCQGYEEGYVDALTFDAAMTLRQMLDGNP